MKLVNCRECGRLTLDTFEGYCSSCYWELEQQMSQIKDYLSLNRSAGVKEIVDGTRVPARLVMKFLNEGRIYPSQL